MKKLIDIVKGAIIGIANVIPGLSGGTIAVSMGIYQRLINNIADILKHPIKVIKDLWLLGIGLVIGIILSIFGITYLLENHEIPATMLFVGFILGSLPIIVKEVKNKKIEARDLIAFVVMIVLVVMFPLLEILGISSTAANMNTVILFLVGILAAGTMIIPGVSGSMVLMTLGYYDKIMTCIKECLIYLKDFNINALFNNILIILPFAIGVVLGIVLVAKIMKWLISKYKKTTNWAILGLIIASPFAIISNIEILSASIGDIIAAIITFFVGYSVAIQLCKIDMNVANKKEVKKNEK